MRIIALFMLLLACCCAVFAQEKPAAQVNMEAAFDALADGKLEQYGGYVVGASEALEREPNTLGNETSISVLQHGADALIHLAEQRRGNPTKFLQTMLAARLVLHTLTERVPDEARWHYYYGVAYALLGDSASIDFAVPEFQTALRCSDASRYAAATRAMLSWCQAEKKRQQEARRRQMQAINQYLQTRGPSFAKSSGWSVCIHCGHTNWNGNMFCLNCKRPQ